MEEGNVCGVFLLKRNAQTQQTLLYKYCISLLSLEWCNLKKKQVDFDYANVDEIQIEFKH